MSINQIALVSLTSQISPSDLAATASAIQKQITRDLGPIWGIQATINSFPDLKSIPAGYWPITISETIDNPDDEGYHWSDVTNHPYAVVLYESDGSWQLTCSHETCEMLVDPYGKRTIVSDSIEDGQGRVGYLVEVCDPCEDSSFAYSVNGILLSDFYTPNYFDPIQNAAVRYSFTGAITSPKQVLKNGYLSWQDTISLKWFQATYFDAAIQIDDVTNALQRASGPLRSKIDRITKNPNKRLSFGTSSEKHSKAKAAFEKSTKSYQENFIQELQKLMTLPTWR